MGKGTRGQYTRIAPARALAGLLVPASLALSSAVLVWAASGPVSAVRAPGPAPVDALLALGAAAACAGLLAVAAVGAAVSLAAIVGGRAAGRIGRLALLLTPRAVRAAVCLAAGVTLTGGSMGGLAVALAAGPGSNPIASSVSRVAPASVLSPGWSPDRPAANSAGQHLPARHTVTSEPRVAGVVVARGDTLWAIAAEHLGRGAADARVAAEWPRWHAANRSTIGPDPNLILPGQRLHAPSRRQPQSRPPPESSPADQASTDREESP